MPTLCFGGSFNPIHNGHLRCAEAVAKKAEYERVLLIPSAVSPHKLAEGLASSADRLAMCRLAAESSPLLDVSDVEMRRPPPSYTIDTARELRGRGWDRVDWLIGADMLLHLPLWHRASELLKEVHFVIMARPGWTIDWDMMPAAFRHLRNNVVEAPLIDVRATDIRQRVAAGLSIEDLVPPAVARYISDHALYRA